MKQEITLDVHELQPPEPMQKALDALHTLGDGQYLKIIHRMQPFPLYDILTDNGFKYKVTTGKVSAFDIYVWHAKDKEVEKIIKDLF
ncbi:MAG: DUF2249 domain-containing protein [Gammaproteobacteria bacterium]|nr:DUF2249 domain-containing protein [Gammaproteobacteria bacterium]MDH5735273.1 DUF2249 domain-containing protein [Gammaproteobacteria bacterium]